MNEERFGLYQRLISHAASRSTPTALVDLLFDLNRTPAQQLEYLYIVSTITMNLYGIDTSHRGQTFMALVPNSDLQEGTPERVFAQITTCLFNQDMPTAVALLQTHLFPRPDLDVEDPECQAVYAHNTTALACIAYTALVLAFNHSPLTKDNGAVS